ncbi:cytochrome P450 [Artemisia annua]|uniref:Cytochrome P450 n=1 Tax=Artemisia annua TaxID=35608 RepID=A0A2U1L9I5_ARTAN|nr:cytochrome P450 [Artemisia annua]
MKVVFPGLVKWVGSAGESLHNRLVDEIRSVVKEEGGVTFSALEKMSLVKSVVYEAFRIEPPVPYQYAKAKEDLVVESHDARFEIKKGETIFGFQTFATNDPKVFHNPDVFVADRLLVMCAGKDLVVLCSRMMLVEFFLRYDTFTVEVAKLPLGSLVKITSFTKAT